MSSTAQALLHEAPERPSSPCATPGSEATPAYKLALLKGNRFNPWHLQAFGALRGEVAVSAFRADSEIQRRFDARNAGAFRPAIEPLYWDTERGNPLRRLRNAAAERWFQREPRLLPFADRLREYDMVQSWELFTDWTAEAVAARERYGTPLSVMVWDNIPFNMERNAYRRALKVRAAAAADVFLVHTERSRRVLRFEDVPDERIVRIEPGVDTRAFHPETANRAAFGLGEDEFVILFVGWLLPRKGIDFLILALRELIQDPALKKYRVRLLAIGDRPGRDRVEQLVARVGLQDRVTLAGAIPYEQMPAAYRAANLFVLPSIAMPEWQEQFGMALLEAMACGVPVVSTYSGAIPEIVGEAGVLCQPNDFVALYESMKSLILNAGYARDLGAAGRARVLERYTLDQYAAALSDVYENLLDRR